MKISQKITKYADQLGIAGSFLCILHCIALPLFISLLTAYSQKNTSLEWLLDIAFVLCALAAVILASKNTSSSLRMGLWLFFFLFSTSVLCSAILPHASYITFISSFGLITLHTINLHYKKKQARIAASL